MFILDYLGLVVEWTSGLLLSPGSSFSLISLAIAASIVALSLLVGDLSAPRRAAKPSLLKRFFPRFLVKHPSTMIDLKYFVLTLAVFNGLFQLSAISYPFVRNHMLDLLVGIFGAFKPTTLSPQFTTVLLTIALYLTYELAWWIHHYLHHRIPALWEFHKIHHSAEVLSPLTEWRVHPVDSWLFFNLVTFCCAMTHAVADFLLGNPIAFLVVSGTNAILAIFWLTISHLHHTHIWMPFTGILGRIVTSPAHHQIHHSKLPHHLDKNLGGHLAIWDWAFGTLYVPSKQRETLDLGIERPQVDLEVFRAFADALATLRPRQPSAAPRTVPAVPEAGRQLEAA